MVTARNFASTLEKAFYKAWNFACSIELKMEFVKKEIDSAKVVVFSKNYCPYCAKAQKALKSIKVDYKLVELVGRPGKSVINL